MAKTDGTDQWRNWTRTGGKSGEGFEARIAELEKKFRTHLGTDFVASGVDYPHPNQKVRALYTAGSMRQNLTGIQFLFDYTSIYGPGIFWFNSFLDEPNSLQNPAAYIQIVNLPDDIRMQQFVSSPAGSQNAGMQILAADDTPMSRVYFGANSVILGVADYGLSTDVFITGAPLTLANATSDYTVNDGALWYRSDTDKFRARMNGTTYDLATTADIPSIATSNKQPLATKTTTYTTTASDGVILCDATSAAFTVTLVTASGNSGLTQTLKKTDSSANVITIDANGSQTIDGSLSYALSAQYAWVTIVSNGSNWFITGAG